MWPDIALPPFMQDLTEIALTAANLTCFLRSRGHGCLMAVPLIRFRNRGPQRSFGYYVVDGKRYQQNARGSQDSTIPLTLPSLPSILGSYGVVGRCLNY